MTIAGQWELEMEKVPAMTNKEGKPILLDFFKAG